MKNCCMVVSRMVCHLIMVWFCRKVVWKHILNVYPDGMSGKERMDYMKKKAYEYQALRDCWKEMVQNGQVSVIISYSCIANPSPPSSKQFSI